MSALGDPANEPLIRHFRARNIGAGSENRMHDDEVARTYGFTGGLVPGIAVYAYVVRPVLEQFGRKWWEGGSATVRFLRPCYEGQEVVVRATPDVDDPETVDLLAGSAEGETYARGRAVLGNPSPQAPDPASYPQAPLPEERPAASQESLAPGIVLGTQTLELTEAAGVTFAEAAGEDPELYRGRDGFVPPGLLLGLANEALSRNVRLGPWIHAESEVTHHSVLRYGDTVEVRGCVADRFERKAHRFAVLDLAFVARPSRLAQHVRHVAIYEPRRQDGTSPKND